MDREQEDFDWVKVRNEEVDKYSSESIEEGRRLTKLCEVNRVELALLKPL